MKQIKFNGWVSVEDALKSDILILPAKSWKTYLFGFIAAVLAIVAFVMLKSISLRDRLLIAGLILVTPANMIFMRKRSITKRKIKYYTSRNQIVRQGSVSSKYIDVVTEKVDRKFEWDMFTGTICRENLTILRINKFEYLAFASYMFESEKDWLAFNQLVQKQISS